MPKIIRIIVVIFAVSLTLMLTAESAFAGVIYTHSVNSRTSDGCADFSGTIDYGWVAIPRGAREYYIDVNGTLTSSCAGNAYLYLHYQYGTQPAEVQLAKTGAHSRHTVTSNPAASIVNKPFTNIYIYACTDHAGWRCGPHRG